MPIIFKPHQSLEFVKNYLPAHPVIVEAGAFNGSETRRLAAMWPQGTIHSFEPVPEIFTQLVENMKIIPSVSCYQLALSSKTGTASFYVSEKPSKPGIASQAGSLHAPKQRLALSPIIFPRTIQVDTITLDDWAAQYHVDHIDFLWLDMQGHELSVLQAAPEMIKTVKVIHTEVNFIEAYEGQPDYTAVKKWLEENGFQEIGRDFEDQTTRFFGNVVFVKK